MWEYKRWKLMRVSQAHEAEALKAHEEEDQKVHVVGAMTEAEAGALTGLIDLDHQVVETLVVKAMPKSKSSMIHTQCRWKVKRTSMEEHHQTLEGDMNVDLMKNVKTCADRLLETGTLTQEANVDVAEVMDVDVVVVQAQDLAVRWTPTEDGIKKMWTPEAERETGETTPKCEPPRVS